MSGLLPNPVSCFAMQGTLRLFLHCLFPRTGIRSRTVNFRNVSRKITPLIAVPPIPQGRELQECRGA